MPSNTVINEKIREALDEKREVMGRVNPDTDPYQSASKNKKSYLKNISKTPYITMTSERRIKIPEFEDTEGFETVTDEEDWEEKIEAVTLSNQEFSEGREDVVYGYKGYNARGKRKFRPTAGIKDLSSEYLSSGNVQFIKKATINWTCHSLEELTFLSERFLSLGERVYVEFGWVLPNQHERRATFIDKNGQINIRPSVDRRTINSELAKRVIDDGKGTFEAFLGRIENFSISSREDGGFDCTTDLMANGIDILNARTDSDEKTNTELYKNRFLNKELSRVSFQNAIKNLHRSLLRIVKQDKDMRYEDIFFDLESADSITEYEKKNYYNKETGEKITKEEYEKSEEQDKYEWIGTNQVKFNGYEKLSKGIYSNENMVVVDTSGLKYGDYRFINVDGWISTISQDFNTKESLEQDPSECWVRWGWFEDNLLNRFFSLVTEEGSVDAQRKGVVYPEVEIRSRVATETTVKTRDQQRLELLKMKKMTSGGLSDKETRELNYLQSGDDWVALGTETETTWKSTTVETNENFQTTHFKEFIFPGKFNVMKRQEDIKNRRKELEKQHFEAKAEYERAQEFRIDQGGDIAKKASEDEIKFQKEMNKAKELLTSTFVNVERNGARALIPIEELDEKEARRYVEETYDFGKESFNIKETGLIPLIFMDELTKAFKEVAGESPFQVEDNTEEGYLRNIFINVGLLQSIFGDGGATTLGENFNRLSEKLQQNSLGLIKLKAEMSPEEPGLITFNSAGFTKKDADFIKKAKEEKTLYEFPVWQNDSIVINQQIESELNSELQKAEYIKDIAKRDLTKEGLSLYHMWNYNMGIAADDREALEDIAYDRLKDYEDRLKTQKDKELKPVFLIGGDGSWFNYGSYTADENYNLSQGGPNLFEEGFNPVTDTEEKKRIKAAETAKKEGQANKQAAEVQGQKLAANYAGYNTDGSVTDSERDDMEENINTTTNSSGRPVTTQPEYALIFISNTIQLTGIAGIKPGDIWTTNYLPKKFRERAHFWTKNVEHKVDSSGWNTTITGQMAWSLGSE